MQSTRKSPDDVDRRKKKKEFQFFVCQINDKEIAMMNRMNVVRQVVFNFVDKEVYHDE